MCQAIFSAVLAVVALIFIVALAVAGIAEGVVWGLILPAPLIVCVLLLQTWVPGLYRKYDSASARFGNHSEESLRTFAAWRRAEVGVILMTMAAYLLVAVLMAPQ